MGDFKLVVHLPQRLNLLHRLPHTVRKASQHRGLRQQLGDALDRLCQGHEQPNGCQHAVRAGRLPCQLARAKHAHTHEAIASKVANDAQHADSHGHNHAAHNEAPVATINVIESGLTHGRFSMLALVVVSE